MDDPNGDGKGVSNEPVVNGLMREFRRVILTQDWPPPGHISFASSHPGNLVFGRITLPYGEQLLWPDHCVAGTPGAAFHPRLEIPNDAVVVRKGIHRGVDSYSAFLENDRKTPVGLDARLREISAGEIALVGLATDYCVLNNALDGSVADAWSRMEKVGVRRGGEVG